jgi:predicted TIM-barrel fold metal-dependent hydrolase
MISRRLLLKNVASSLPFGLPQVGIGLSAPTERLIWDVHFHLSGVSGETPEERMAHLIQYADCLGVQRLVLSLGMPFVENPSPQQLREANDQVLKALHPWPDRAFGFVYLNPNYLDFSLREFDRCVRDGPMVGVKLWVAKRCNASELDPIVDRATGMQAPILQHTWLKTDGNGAGESTPFDFAELAKRHPRASLICGHTGGDWERGIRAVRSLRNISVEIAGSDPTSGFVEMAVRELGAERVIYGSDAGGRSFASQLAKVMGAEIPESSRKLILGENLRRMLTPILKAKGHRV